MEIKEMTIEQLEERKVAIAVELDNPEADLDALENEARSIKEELERRKLEATKKAEIRSAVASGMGETIEKPIVEGRKKMTINEIRNSAEYIDAFAEYIKTGKDTEVRNMLTTENDTTPNGSATIPVPEFVYDIVKTAWERDGITSRVRKAYLRGNLKVGFEISGSDAVVHGEGASAISPEDLVLGVVELVPQSIKKVVQISDEALDLRGREFLEYIYDELTYRIAKKAADTLVAKIIACGTVSTTTCPAVPILTEATLEIGTVAKAMAKLSDEAANPIIMMNKLTWGSLKAIQAANSYGYDPFENLPIAFNSNITAYSAATTGVTYMLVGDLDQGALMNFPNGEDIEFKFDNMTLKKQDLVEVLGRQYVGIGVVAPNAFVKVTK
jgi:HK97 family phage major capsid protein